MWIVTIIVLGAIVIVTLIIFIMAVYGQKKIFNPNDKEFFKFTMPYTDFYIKGISGRHFNNFDGRRTVIYCHGNNDNITERKYIIDICNEFKLNLLLFDYQGFGKSIGTPYQYSLQPDADCAYDYLISKGIKCSDILIWGESLGGCPAIYLAETRKCAGMLLLSTYSSMTHVLNDYDAKIWSLSAKIFPYVFDPSDNVKRISNVKIPVIIVHSYKDDMIPFQSAQRLYNSVPHKCKVLIKIDGTHSQPLIDKSLLSRVINYFANSELNVNDIPDFGPDTANIQL